MTAPWPAPTPPPPAYRPPVGHGARNVIVGVFGIVLALAAINAVTHDDTSATSGGGGTFYASAGWSIDRAADLSVKIQYDHGATGATADCAMKAIVGAMTWTNWQSLGPLNQEAAIIGAREGC